MAIICNILPPEPEINNPDATDFFKKKGIRLALEGLYRLAHNLEAVRLLEDVANKWVVVDNAEEAAIQLRANNYELQNKLVTVILRTEPAVREMSREELYAAMWELGAEINQLLLTANSIDSERAWLEEYSQPEVECRAAGGCLRGRLKPFATFDYPATSSADSSRA